MIIALAVSACMVSHIAPVQAAGTVNDWIITDYQTSSSTNGIIHFVVFMNISGFSNAPTVYERSEAEAINGVDWTSTTAVPGSWVRDGRAFNYAAIFDLGSSSPGHGKHGLVRVHIYDGSSIVKTIDTSLEVQHFYRGNGGTPDSTEVDYWPNGNQIAPTVTRTGYTFAGWTLMSTTTATVMNALQYTYTAQWTANTYTLTYEGMGGTPSKTSQTGKYNSAWGTLATATRTGYTFGGWYSRCAIVGSTITYRDAITSSTICTGNAPAFAKWTANKYYLAFNANGGSGTMANQTFRYGSAQTISANTFTRSNCIFTGWNTKADGTGTAYSDKQSVSNLSATNGATITLYAQWGHWIFDSWSTAPDGSGTTYNPGDALPNSNLDLYAQWRYEHVTS